MNPLSRFPPDSHPTPAYMNWAIVMFGAVVVFAAIYYALVGQKRFNPPMRKDEFWKRAVEQECLRVHPRSSPSHIVVALMHMPELRQQREQHPHHRHHRVR